MTLNGGPVDNTPAEPRGKLGQSDLHYTIGQSDLQKTNFRWPGHPLKTKSHHVAYHLMSDLATLYCRPMLSFPIQSFGHSVTEGPQNSNDCPLCLPYKRHNTYYRQWLICRSGSRFSDTTGQGMSDNSCRVARLLIFMIEECLANWAPPPPTQFPKTRVWHPEQRGFQNLILATISISGWDLLCPLIKSLTVSD